MNAKKSNSSVNQYQEEDLLSLLVKEKHISPTQADTVRQRSKRTQVPIHQALINLELVNQETLYKALSKITGYPFVILHKAQISPEATGKVSEKIAMHYQFIPISLTKNSMTAAFANPPSLRDLENLRLLLGFRIQPNLATPNEIKIHLKKIYGLGADTIMQIRENKKDMMTETKENIYYAVESELGEGGDADAPLIRLVNQILLEAVEMNATDIHIEPYKESLKLRYRIDGMLRDVPVPKDIHGLADSIISRVKIMANLNIAERRLPHDGRLRVNVEDDSFDLRVSIIPTRFGETVCLRILNRSSIFLNMTDLGLNDHDRKIMNHLINLPHGIVLVTGPTGSGKTTTLYASLAQVKEQNPELKIITVEDPIEYELEGTSQIQVKSDIGLTFASSLRSILRHDPDIILVGEIRDEETAEIAIRSSMTGHLVFSTLHTNDSVSSVNRLVDMGVEPYLVSSSLVACLAQRLVRRICPHCKRKVDNITPHIRKEISELLKIPEEDVHAWEGAGCPDCDHTGYKGRVAIYEFFLIDEEVQDMISAHASTGELRRIALKKGMHTLRQDGWKKLAKGLTTINEVSRITGNFLIGYDMALDDK